MNVAEVHRAGADTDRLLMIEVCESFPVTYGLGEHHHRVHVDEIDVLIESEATPYELVDAPATAVEEAIARFISEMIPDGATLQTGIGAVPNVVASVLAEGDGGDYGIHSEMFTNGLMRLHQRGPVARGLSRPSRQETAAARAKSPVDVPAGNDWGLTVAINRRSFLKAALAGAGAAAVGAPAADAVVPSVNLTKPLSTLLGGPPPKYPNVQNVVVMMMENRSTDHFLGWWGDRDDVRFDSSTSLPGRQTVDFGINGERNWAGHPYLDPGHSHSTGRHQILDHDGDGVPDGWGEDRPDTGTDRYARSYYTADDLPVIDRIVHDFTSFDRYFTSWMGNTFPNRYYMHSAQSHGIDNNDFPPQFAATHPQWTAGFDWPTVWDFLEVRGVTWKYYFSNLPAIALFGARHLPNTRPIAEYYADCAAGTLPQVSFVDPFFLIPEGLANDDHPHADIRLGQEFYSDVITSFLRSRQWAKGALFINYDEWGGFFDHVVPSAVGTDVDPLATYGGSVDYTQRGEHTTAQPADFGLHGFRTPAFLLSPFARNTGVNPPATRERGRSGRPAKPIGDPTVDRTCSTDQDHTTILQFIAENWALPLPGSWDPGFSRRPRGSMVDAFDPSIAEEGAHGNPEVDVDAYEYVAPPEARTTALPVPASSVSDLWGAADWIDSMGFAINTRFADALPVTRVVDRVIG